MKPLLLVALLAACGSPSPRPPMPAPELPAELDRIQLGIVTHELALCRAGLGRGR